MLGPQDRVLILAPHPDDETLCTGGIIQQALAMDLPIHVVFLTYGDNNEWSFVKYRKKVTVGSKAVEGMGLVRHGEAVKATGVLGLKPGAAFLPGLPRFRDAADLGEAFGRPAGVPQHVRQDDGGRVSQCLSAGARNLSG